MGDAQQHGAPVAAEEERCHSGRSTTSSIRSASATSHPPQSVITVSAEGAVTYKALLFIPVPALRRSTIPRTIEPGLQLYSSGVMIMDKCADLLPECFNFVRGVVDSPDLSLNISRELLQHDRQLKVISANLEKKIRSGAGADAAGRPGGL